MEKPGSPYSREGISFIDHPAQTISNKLPFIMKEYIFLFYKTSYLSTDVSRTNLSPLVRYELLFDLVQVKKARNPH
jgi:hypothetical protein